MNSSLDTAPNSLDANSRDANSLDANSRDVNSLDANSPRRTKPLTDAQERLQRLAKLAADHRAACQAEGGPAAPQSTLSLATPAATSPGRHAEARPETRPETDAAPQPAPSDALADGQRLTPSQLLAARRAAEAQKYQLRAKGLVKSYRKDKIEVPVLRGVDFQVERSQFAAIVGQSGSGKSTLLHLLATLDLPDQGKIYFDGERIDCLPAVARDRLRNERFGMIFQFYHLLPELTALENVLAPLMIRHGVFRYFRKKREHTAMAEALMERVGLSHRLKHRPRELSGGEMQRAAIARALVTQPELLLADEPTGNLDTRTGAEILELLRSLNEQQNLTIVMVTHDNSIAAQADFTVQLREGMVEQV